MELNLLGSPEFAGECGPCLASSSVGGSHVRGIVQVPAGRSHLQPP